jgi:hypothetical protein
MTREELEALAERIENEIGWRQFGIYNGPRLSLGDFETLREMVERSEEA